MRRIRLKGSISDLTIRLEGRLVAKYAVDTLKLLLLYQAPSMLKVDVSEVSSVDSVGEQVLSCFGRLGVKFVAHTEYALGVCERLHLPLLGEPSSTLPQAM